MPRTSALCSAPPAAPPAIGPPSGSPYRSSSRPWPRAGAYHEDLNVRNILISAGADGRRTAHAIDVDRVVWGHPGDPALVRTNLDRLHRSARKQGLL